MDLLRIFKLNRLHKTIINFSVKSLFCTFHSDSVFSIFFKEAKVLQAIQDVIERHNYVNRPEKDEDGEDIEHQVLRRIYYVLS